MSCGLGTCVDPACYLCRTIGGLPQPTTMFDRSAKFAVPDASLKKPAKHPSQTKRKRKALEAPPLRVKR